MFYVKSIHNPQKHPLIPDDYPWIVSDNFIENSIEASKQEIDQIIASFDLTAYNNAIHNENLEQQRAQREYGLHLLPELIDMMGARNLALSKSGVVVNMISLAQDNASVKLLIETGALKTARSVCISLKNKYPDHIDIYDHLISDINQFLSENGYE